MRNLSITVAAAASVALLSFATASRADDKPHSKTTTTTTTTQPSTSTSTTTQPSTSTSTMTQPGTSSTTTVQTAPPPQTGTATTTAAPYAPVPTGGDVYAESTTKFRPNRPLLVTGAGIFLVSYGASVVTAAVSPLDADENLYIPVVGPWLDLDERPDNLENEDLNKALIITSGVAQGAGVLVALSSLIIPETRSTTMRAETAKAAPFKPEFRVLPVSYRAGAGLAAVGTF